MGTRKYPVSEDVHTRPFHLWDENNNKRLPNRFYSSPVRAHDYAMHVALWDLKIGKTIAVLDVRVGKCLCQYTRRLDWIELSVPKPRVPNEE